MASVILGIYPPLTKAFLADSMMTLLEASKPRQAMSIPVVDSEGRLRGVVTKQGLLRWLSPRLRKGELSTELYKNVEESGVEIAEAHFVDLRDLSDRTLLEKVLSAPTGEVYITSAGRLVGEVSPYDLLRLSIWAYECNVRLSELRPKRLVLLGHDAPLTTVAELLAQNPIVGITYEGSLVGLIGPEELITAVIEHARCPETLEVVKAWAVARPTYAYGYEDEDLCKALRGLRTSQEPYMVVLGRDERVHGYLEIRDMLRPLKDLFIELLRVQLVT